MRAMISIALLVVACGDDGVRGGTDASVERLDMSAMGGRDMTTPTDGGGRSEDAAPPPDGSRPVEDCSTDADEDGDRAGGCEDPECADVERCIAADLAERDASDWTVCQSLTFDADATRMRCDEGLPAWTGSERELRCSIVPTEVRVDVWCAPERTDDEQVWMRWRVAMDTTGTDRMLGPQTWESTHYMPELTFSNTVTEYGSGGSGGDPLYPTADFWDGTSAIAVGWRTLPRGARFIAFTTVSVDISTIQLFDGGANHSSSGPSYVHNAAFEVPSAGIGD